MARGCASCVSFRAANKKTGAVSFFGLIPLFRPKLLQTTRLCSHRKVQGDLDPMTGKGRALTIEEARTTGPCGPKGRYHSRWQGWMMLASFLLIGFGFVEGSLSTAVLVIPLAFLLVLVSAISLMLRNRSVQPP